MPLLQSLLSLKEQASAQVSRVGELRLQATAAGLEISQNGSPWTLITDLAGSLVSALGFNIPIANNLENASWWWDAGSQAQADGEPNYVTGWGYNVGNNGDNQRVSDVPVAMVSIESAPPVDPYSFVLSGVPDLSPQKNRATPFNLEEADFQSTGAGGQSTASTLLDGVDEYLEVGSPTPTVLSPDVGDSFSVSAWVLFSTGTQRGIMTKRTTAAGNRGWGLEVNGGTPFFQLVDNIASSRVGINTNASFNDGAWHHVVATKGPGEDASDLRLYVDAVLQPVTVFANTFVSGGGTTFNSAAPFCLGSVDGNNSNWIGRLDEMAFYSRELTSSEVVQIYNGGAPPLLTSIKQPFTGDLSGYWRMGEPPRGMLINLDFRTEAGALRRILSCQYNRDTEQLVDVVTAPRLTVNGPPTFGSPVLMDVDLQGVSLPSYQESLLPVPFGPNRLAWVSDAAGGPVPAYYDGTAWLRMDGSPL